MCLIYRTAKTRKMSDRGKNSLILKAVQKYYPQFAANTKLATFKMPFQAGSLGDNSLSSRFPICHFSSSGVLSSHTRLFCESSPLKIWVLWGIQSGLICLRISAFSLQSMCKRRWMTHVLDKAFNLLWDLTAETAKKLLGCAVLGFIPHTNNVMTPKISTLSQIIPSLLLITPYFPATLSLVHILEAPAVLSSY